MRWSVSPSSLSTPSELSSINSMSLDYFIDIRFADPVLSLSLNSYGLVYGSSIGRILFYTFHSQQETVLAEFSEECIRGVYVSSENNIYIAVGDRYCIGMTSPTSHKQLVHHDYMHNDELCLATQVFMKEDLVCVVPLGERNTDGIILTHISTHIKKKQPMLPFKEYSVPYDFDGDRLLWMEWEGNDRIFKYIEFESSEVKTIGKFAKGYGQIGFCKLAKDAMIIVKNFKEIELIDLETGVPRQSIGIHRYDIVAVTWVRVQDRGNERENQYSLDENSGDTLLVVSIDYDCNICIWDKQGLIFRYNITDFPELTLEYKQKIYFTMGYPYVICIADRKIAFSTDLGVLVVSFPILKQFSIFP